MSERVVRLPDVGEGVAEAELVSWQVAVGDLVHPDSVLAEVLTDKATVEVFSPVAGRVTFLRGEVGEVLAVGSDFVGIETDADIALPTALPDDVRDPRQGAAHVSQQPAVPAPSPDDVRDARQGAAHPSPERAVAAGVGTGVGGAPHHVAPGERPIAAPAVRQRAREAGVDLRLVPGHAPAGRITHDDLAAYLAGATAPLGVIRGAPRRRTEQRPVVGLRRRIADRMALAASHIPHITYVDEVDVGAVDELRRTLNDNHPDAPRLTLLPFLMRAIVLAVADQPHLNATFDDGAELLTVYGPVHVGIATQTPNGLLVPVVHDADQLDLWATAAEVGRVADAARSGKAGRDELSGSTITITSLGALGGLVTTPIINHPEVAIVGVNKMQVRPVWEGQQFQPRTMMNLSSSFDHRIVDGWDAATFVQRVKALVETPALLFIDPPEDRVVSDGADCDVLIVGAGPGGYVCTLRAAQLGLKVVIVERADVGGTCLNVGCIPSKAIIHAADELTAAQSNAHLGITTEAARLDLAVTMAWKDGVVHRLTGGVATLLDHAGVRRIAGAAQIVDGKTVRVADETITTTNLVLATGSEPVALAQLPFGGRVLSSTDTLALTEVPERLLVVGAGYIGLELGTAYRKLGAQVTVVEVQPRILPQYDERLTRPVLTRLKALGVTVLLGTSAGGLGEDGLAVTDRDGHETVLPADAVLVTVGRRPVTDELASLHLAMDGHAVHVDDQCRTSIRGVFAIGDVTGEPMLAHRAMAQGALVAEVIAGMPGTWDHRVVPEVCFTDPEIVRVGLSPDEATAAGVDHLVGRFMLGANGRALSLGRDDGFVRVVARRADHLVLGLQAVGTGVSELAAAFTTTLEMGAVLEDIAATVHAHPSLSEAVQEAALAALGRAIHRA